MNTLLKGAWTVESILAKAVETELREATEFWTIKSEMMSFVGKIQFNAEYKSYSAIVTIGTNKFFVGVLKQGFTHEQLMSCDNLCLVLCGIGLTDEQLTKSISKATAKGIDMSNFTTATERLKVVLVVNEVEV
jgi:hypothetical protein